MIAPLPSSTYTSPSHVQFPAGTTIVHGILEDRSKPPSSWSVVSSTQSAELSETDNLFEFIPSTSGVAVSTRSKASILRFLDTLGAGPISLDITGLSHHVWMPLLRALIEDNRDFQCTYSEPEQYTFKSNPRPGEFFDLSERIRGFLPIPTFITVSRRSQLDACVVPILGFEGTRLKFLIEMLQPEGRNVFPVIGVPGFKLEYPFHTYEGNADPLEADRAWTNVSFVDASCPFSLFHSLAEIERTRISSQLKIAPIGTKPHALGAAIYAVRNPTAELVYDHPIRKKSRTTGAGKCHVYNVAEFVRSL
jgi:hypothetical protein